MKKNRIASPKSKPEKTPLAKPMPKPAPNNKPRLERLELWLSAHRKQVLGILILSWILIRISMFHTVANGPLFEMYRWPASDNFFFDTWAKKLAAGDWLNREPIHPYHGWHEEFSDYYFKQHPEKLLEIQAANPGHDSTFIPGKILWNNWYGGNTYHQEPLYTYVLAILYKITGQGVYWMLLLQLLLGVLSGVLLWRIAQRFFGDSVALLTGVLYLFCGIVLFQEVLILRTSWIVFFVLATIWSFDKAIEKSTGIAFLKTGLTLGLAFLLQSTFLLFLIGVIAIYGWLNRKNRTLFARNSAMILAGFLLVYGLLMLRNSAVGAPLFSVSSVGAVTFVASNVQGTKTIETWMPDASKCAEIMGKSNGAFGKAAWGAIKTHPSFGSYLQLLWSKFRQAINGVEWANNENYYFYKQMVPALDVAFLNFYWFVWLGVAGLLFSFYYKKRCAVLYLAIALQLAVLIGFYVLGRFRCPLAVLLLPFAAYALLECFRIAQNKLRGTAVKLAVVGLCFYVLTYVRYRPGETHLDTTDYSVFYDLNYYDRVKNSAESGQYTAAIAAHTEFLDCTPAWIKAIKPNAMPKNPMDIDILYFFAEHFQIHAYLFEDSGNKPMASKWNDRAVVLKQIADKAQKKRRH